MVREGGNDESAVRRASVMSGRDRFAEHKPMRLLVQFGWNARAALNKLLCNPRRELRWPGRSCLLLGAATAVLAVVAVMALIDPWSIARVHALPVQLVAFFQSITDFGLGGWFLWPTGLALVGLALLDRPALPRLVQGVMAALAVRFGFVFLAIGAPGLFVAVVKRMIGRARPFVAGNDVWAYQPLVWQPAYASMPSGHAATAFSAAIAVGALWPHTRVAMWVYAALIAASRVAIAAHHPSDVLTGAIIGAVGALLIRQWFVCRRLGFATDGLGHIKPLPGPSPSRIKKAAAAIGRLRRSCGELGR